MTKLQAAGQAGARLLAILGAGILALVCPGALVAEQGLRAAPRGQEELASQWDAMWKAADGPTSLAGGAYPSLRIA